MIRGRFVAIDVRDDGYTYFTIEFEADAPPYPKHSFRQLDFEDFVKRAAALVRPPVVLTDTDQLIGIWFNFPHDYSDDDVDFVAHFRD